LSFCLFVFLFSFFSYHFLSPSCNYIFCLICHKFFLHVRVYRFPILSNILHYFCSLLSKSLYSFSSSKNFLSLISMFLLLTSPFLPLFFSSSFILYLSHSRICLFPLLSVSVSILSFSLTFRYLSFTSLSLSLSLYFISFCIFSLSIYFTSLSVCRHPSLFLSYLFSLSSSVLSSSLSPLSVSYFFLIFLSTPLSILSLLNFSISLLSIPLHL